MKHAEYVKETHSTNALMWEKLRKEQLAEGFVLYAGYQTAGKGQAGNSWESEAGRNLLFSLVVHPGHIPMDQLFFVSQLVSVAIKRTLDACVEGVTIKWPNDIYVGDRKIAGILIENSFQANRVVSVIGVGMNVNQRIFRSNAPNPVSLRQLTGKLHNRMVLLNRIWQEFMDMYRNAAFEAIRSEYAAALYRKDGLHAYRVGEELFRARIVGVDADGRLELETESGERKGFYFKEVSFV